MRSHETQGVDTNQGNGSDILVQPHAESHSAPERVVIGKDGNTYYFDKHPDVANGVVTQPKCAVSMPPDPGPK